MFVVQLPHVPSPTVCLFSVSFLLFPSISINVGAIILMVFLACFQMGFYFVTTGWIFEIGLCDNSINQCLKCHPSRYTHISHTLTRRMMSQSLLYTSRSGLTSRNPPWTGKTVCPLGDIAGSVVYRKLAFASVSKEQNGWVGVRV